MRTVFRIHGSLCLAGLLAACGGDDGPSGSTPLIAKLSGIGDSIMQGMDAGSGTIGEDQIENSFARGTNSEVNSLLARYGRPAQEFVSVSGATMIDGPDGDTDSAVVQARRICEQSVKPDRIVILLGGNDVCRLHPGEPLPEVEVFREGLRSAIDEMAGTACGLPAGTKIHVLSMPRVDLLKRAGEDKDEAAGSTHCSFVWSMGDICPIVTQSSDPAELDQVGSMIDQYNQGIADEVAAANVLYGPSPGLSFTTDWAGTTSNTSIGTFVFGPGDLSDLDCFHPSIEGQRKLACAAWESWEGVGNASACLQ